MTLRGRTVRLRLPTAMRGMNMADEPDDMDRELAALLGSVNGVGYRMRGFTLSRGVAKRIGDDTSEPIDTLILHALVESHDREATGPVKIDLVFTPDEARILGRHLIEVASE